VLLSDLVEALGHRVSALFGEVVQAAFFLDQACSAELFEGVPEPVRQSSAEVCAWKTYRLRQLGAAGVSVTQRQQDRLFKRRLIHLRARVRAAYERLVKTRWLARAELAVITLRPESDELVVDVEVQRPAVAVGAARRRHTRHRWRSVQPQAASQRVYAGLPQGLAAP
jgi:hypothetical protein